MTTRRLHHAPLSEHGGPVTLGEAARRHARVLRLSPGDALVLFDGAGGEADARVVEAGDALRCEAGPRRAVPGSPQHVVLCYCLPKGNSKLDLAVRGATEVGVAAIHLAISERSVARPAPEAFAKRLPRLERIAEEAARQSGRAAVPDLLPPAPLAEVAARAPASARRLACAPGGAAIEGGGTSAWLLVGPEGGLSEAELRALEGAGWERVSLGDTVLRTETAATVAPALVAAALRR